MPKHLILVAARNLAILVFVAIPSFFLAAWVQALVRETPEAGNVGYVTATGAFYYLSNVVPVLVGGLIHQVIWLGIPRTWSRRARLAVALVSALVLLPASVLVAWGGPARSLAAFTIPLLLALLVYVMLLHEADRAAAQIT